MQRWFTRIWLAMALTFGLVALAWAQADVMKDIERWTTLAQRAEAALDSGNASESELVAFRSAVVEFRTEFDAAGDLNAARITTLREQLAALGAVPEGESATAESPDVVATRADLNAQLSALLVPVQRAEAEFVRADAIVSQIDKALRDRQAEQLRSAAPSPLNPVYWEQALRDLTNETKALWYQPPPENPAESTLNMKGSLPVASLLAVLGLVLIVRGRSWSRMIVRSLQRFGARGFGIWRFLASLLRIFLPFTGLILFALAAISTGYFSSKVDELFLLMAFLGGAVLGMRWVSERVFSRDDDEALVLLPAQKRSELRFHVVIITALIVVGELIAQILKSGDPAPASEPVLLFPITLLVAASLYRIGLILRGFVDPGTEDSPEPRNSTLMRVLQGFGTGAIVVAVVTPLLAAAGYFRAADALMPPYIMTLALLGLVMALQRFAADVYGVITGQGVQAREKLLPVLFGLILLVLVTPLLALVWGARVTDLTELWSSFGRGFAVGDTRISPTDFLTFAVIFVIGYAATRLMQSALRNNVLPKTQLDLGGQNAIVSGVGYIGIFLAALAAITGAGIDLSSLAIVAGALSVGIGFGLQNIVSNFVSGIILLIERPISEGDWIEVGGQMGYVRDISVRSTRIETFDRTDVIVPNADLVSGTVTNYTRGNTIGRVIVPIGVAYGTDTKKVEEILREIAEAQPQVVATPPPSVLFLNFGADALEFEVRCVLRDVNWMMMVKNDINHAIAERFAKEGIEIPFAQRDVWLRNPEVLHPAPEPAAASKRPKAKS
jgi:small-conductance mechanosensitive channel